MKKASLILGVLALSACQTATEALDKNDIRKTELIEAECAVYFTVRDQMASQGQTANATMTEGCPTTAQSIKADITPQVSPPTIESRFGRIIYQRMIARGMPKEVADEVGKSKAFYVLVAKSDALYG